MKRNKKALLVVFIVVILVGAGIGIAVANQQPQKSEDSNETTTEVNDSDVYVELLGLDNAEDVIPAKVDIIVSGEAELLDKENNLAEEDMFELNLNKRTKIATLDEGSYQFHVMTAPIEIDGSTYRLPSDPTEFEVQGKGEEVNLEVKLERIDVEDMTREQLLAVADRLDKAGEPEIAQSARDRAETAPSVEGSAEEVVQESRANDTGAPTEQSSEVSAEGGDGSGGETPTSTGGGSSGSGGNSDPGGSSSSGSTNPNAGKTWHEAVYENVWVVDQAAYQRPIYGEYLLCSCGATFNSQVEWSAHSQAEGRGSSHAYKVLQNEIGFEVVPEQGHWEQRLTRAAGWY